MAFLLTLITLAVVVAVLTRGFRVGEDATADAAWDLEETKRAKYRELRDLELDWRTGKLSDADYDQLRGQLRREAAQLLAQASPATEAPSSTNGRHRSS